MAIRGCERREAISSYKDEIATLSSVTRDDNLLYELATFPSVTRNDNLLHEIVQPVPTKTKESSSLFAMTDEISMTIVSSLYEKL